MTEGFDERNANDGLAFVRARALDPRGSLVDTSFQVSLAKCGCNVAPLLAVAVSSSCRPALAFCGGPVQAAGILAEASSGYFGGGAEIPTQARTLIWSMCQVQAL